MYWPLGQSARIKQEWQQRPLEARYALIGLYILAFMPLTLVIKRWVADVMCVILGLVFLYRCWQVCDWAWLKEPPVAIALALWAYTLLIVTPLALDPWLSLMRAATWWRFILMFAAIAYWLSDYTEEIKRICVVVAVILFVVAADAYIQYFSGFSLTGTIKPSHRLTGPFAKLIVGIYLAKLSFPILGILLYYAWQARRFQEVILYFTLNTFLLGAIALSNERTALITFTAGLALIGVMLFFFLKKARWQVVLMGIVQASLLYTIYTTQPDFKLRMSESSMQASSFGHSPYAQLWKASYEMWKQNPITGVGLMNFRVGCPPLLEAGVVSYCDLHSHSVYLEWLSETGIIGFAAIIALVISLIHAIGRRIRITEPERFIIVSFSLAGLLPTFFPLAATQSFLSNWPAIMTWLSISLALGMIRNVPYD